MTTENQTATDASGTDGTKTVPPIPTVEIKEGSTFLDGKKVVPESDLIAAKKGLEGQLTQQQTAHEQAIDKAKLDASEAQQQIANLNAKLQENEQARQTGAVTDEDAAKVKQELETAASSLEKANTASLEYRRALLVMKYGIAEDTIKEKGMSELDSFEEALKAVSTARGGGVGPYAIGGGVGEAAPQTNMERATRILESTPIRGVRNPINQT